MPEQTAAFKAEVQQLLDLVVHSLYSKKEIFLRELISNASDAIDRAQFEGLTDAALLEDAPEWTIQILLDRDAKTLRIEDNGIGMTADEVETNLGTIARSGTRAFLDALKAKSSGGTAAPELIGRFGVGFYAAFMVAGEVVVDTLRRGPGQTAVRWRSSGDGTYHIDASEKTTPGTVVTLQLREEAGEFADAWRLRQIVRQYSDYIAYPIRLTTREADKSETDEKPLNETKAIWKRTKAEIKDEERNAFYKHLSHDFEEPLRHIHIQAEGAVEFQALLFIPRRPPMDLFMPNRRGGLHLYVRNVFIGSQFDSLLPEYLRFVHGVVDCSDLPLNVSREMLQDDAVIRRIRSNLVGRILATLDEMKTQAREEFNTFFQAFGPVLKEGLHSDFAHREKILELMLFSTLNAPADAWQSLREYRDAMPSKQEYLYYLQAEDASAARQSPHLEWCRAQDFDVLLMTDPVDAWIAGDLDAYDGIPFRAVDRDPPAAKPEKPEEESTATADDATAETPLTNALKTALGDTVRAVRISERLRASACCLVTEAHALSPAMERVMRAMNRETPRQSRILEINPEHALIRRLVAQIEKGATADTVREEAGLLVSLALLAEGSPIPNPGDFARRIAAIMAEAPPQATATTPDPVEAADAPDA